MSLCVIPGVGEMANTGFWKKEVYAVKFKFFTGFLVLALLAVGIPLLYDITVRLAENLPSQEFLKGQEVFLTDYRLYIWSQWFGKNLYQFGSVMAIIFGAGIISSEVSRKTIQFILARPILREDVFTVKFIVNFAALALVVVASTVVLYITVVATGHKIPVVDMVQNIIMALAGMAVIYSMAVYFSTVFDRTLKSAVITGIIAMVLFVPGFFPGLHYYSVYYHMAGSDIALGKGFPFIPLIVLIIITAAFYMLGRNRFVKKDF